VAAADLTETTIIKTNSLFDSTDNGAKCLVKLCELVQQPEPRMDDWLDGALTVRQFLPGTNSNIVGMPTGNDDQSVPRRSEFQTTEL